MATTLGLFKELEATRSPLEKMEILRQNDTEFLRRLLVYALHPDMVYGIKKINTPMPANVTVNGDEVFDNMFALLDKLAARQLTGHAAQSAVHELLTDAGAFYDIVKRVILKDLRCGVGDTLVNKVFPGLIPTFAAAKAEEYNEARVQKLLDSRGYVWVEEKYEGKRIIADAEGQRHTDLLSYNGKPETEYNRIREQLQFLAAQLDTRMMFDTELMFGMFGTRDKNSPDTICYLFDLMTWDEFSSQDCPDSQEERTQNIQDLLEAFPQPNIKAANGRKCYTMEQIDAFYKEVTERGGEGLIIKDPWAKYVFDRSWNWIKRKVFIDVDVIVEAAYQGEAGKQHEHHLGGFTVIVTPDVRKIAGFQHCPGVGNTLTNVGGGYSNEQRAEFWANRDQYIGKTMKVKTNLFTPEGNLRFPQFIEFRDDK